MGLYSNLQYSSPRFGNQYSPSQSHKQKNHHTPLLSFVVDIAIDAITYNLLTVIVDNDFISIIPTSLLMNYLFLDISLIQPFLGILKPIVVTKVCNISSFYQTLSHHTVLRTINSN